MTNQPVPATKLFAFRIVIDALPYNTETVKHLYGKDAEPAGFPEDYFARQVLEKLVQEALLYICDASRKTAEGFYSSAEFFRQFRRQMAEVRRHIWLYESISECAESLGEVDPITGEDRPLPN